MLTACLLGGGSRSVEHCRSMRAREALCVSGIYDPDSACAGRWLKSARVPFYNSCELMLERTRPDFALVSIPHDRHLEAVDMLSASGIHIMKEKPLARSVGEGLDMLALCDSRQVDLFITMQRRVSSIYQQFKNSIAMVGVPRRFHARYTLNIDSPTSGWRASRKTAGGGAIIDMGYHMIDLLIWCFGLPSAVVAHFEDGGGDSVEDEARISFIYDSGLTGEIFVSRKAGPKGESVSLTGSDGRITADRKELTHMDAGGRLVNRVYDPGDWQALLDRQLSLFLSGSSASRRFFVNAHEHLRHAAFIEACYASRLVSAAVNPQELLAASVN